MGRDKDVSPTVLDVVLQQWPTTVFVPAILVLVSVLVGVTRWWDERDGMRVAGRTVREKWRPRWRRQKLCTCSWHSIATETRTEGG